MKLVCLKVFFSDSWYGSPFIFSEMNFHHSWAVWWRELFEKKILKSPHYEEEEYEIVKIFGGFRQDF
jgi:hypothetical protein